ncbi:MAG: hypothetical protein WBZ36_28270 [Candidatus Nitrosopolaris sp.]
MSKVYSEETYDRVASEFVESDVYKGLVLLRRITSLLEKKLSVNSIQDSLEKYGDKLGLSAEVLKEVWRIAVSRAPVRVRKKIMAHIARQDGKRFVGFLRPDGIIAGEMDPSEMGIDVNDPAFQNLVDT